MSKESQTAIRIIQLFQKYYSNKTDPNKAAEDLIKILLEFKEETNNEKQKPKP